LLQKKALTIAGWTFRLSKEPLKVKRVYKIDSDGEVLFARALSAAVESK
jgi:hypothetical protein